MFISTSVFSKFTTPNTAFIISSYPPTKTYKKDVRKQKLTAVLSYRLFIIQKKENERKTEKKEVAANQTRMIASMKDCKIKLIE
jgi:hypothetical protein